MSSLVVVDNDDQNKRGLLDMIDSLLQTDWKTINELSPIQKNGLWDLKERIKNGITTRNSIESKVETNSDSTNAATAAAAATSDDDETNNHLDDVEQNSSTEKKKNVEETTAKSSETTTAANNGNGSTTDATNKYLLSEFHGIRSPTKSKWDIMRKAVHANALVRKLQKLSSATKLTTLAPTPSTKYSFPSKYAPPEWYELSYDQQCQLSQQFLSWEKLTNWDFDIFKLSELSAGQPLLFVGWAILSSPHAQCVMEQTIKDGTHQDNDNDTIDIDEKNKKGYGFLETYDIAPTCMIDFLRAVETRYHRDNPYHNNIHAADVLQTTHIFIEGMDAKKLGLGGGTSSMKLQTFSLLIAAAVHDIEHPGLNNTFQTNTFSQKALTYNDRSVLENYHASVAFKMVLGKDGNDKWNIFQNMAPTDLLKSKKLITEAILGTDLSTHFTQFEAVKQLAVPTNNTDQDEEDDDEKKKTDLKASIAYSWTILTFLMHMADISNLAKPKYLSLQWTDRILDEFFRQGDQEKDMKLPVSPLCDRNTTSRPDSQMGFINYIIRPSFELLGLHMPPHMETVVLPLVESNYKFWQTELEQGRISRKQIIEETTTTRNNTEGKTTERKTRTSTAA